MVTLLFSVRGLVPLARSQDRRAVYKPFLDRALKASILPAPPNYPFRDPKYHLIETIRPLIELHWGVLVAGSLVMFSQAA